MKYKIILTMTEEYEMDAPNKDYVTQNFYPDHKKIIGGDIINWKIEEA